VNLQKQVLFELCIAKFAKRIFAEVDGL